MNQPSMWPRIPVDLIRAYAIGRLTLHQFDSRCEQWRRGQPLSDSGVPDPSRSNRRFSNGSPEFSSADVERARNRLTSLFQNAPPLERNLTVAELDFSAMQALLSYADRRFHGVRCGQSPAPDEFDALRIDNLIVNVDWPLSRVLTGSWEVVVRVTSGITSDATVDKLIYGQRQMERVGDHFSLAVDPTTADLAELAYAPMTCLLIDGSRWKLSLLAPADAS